MIDTNDRRKKNLVSLQNKFGFVAHLLLVIIMSFSVFFRIHASEENNSGIQIGLTILHLTNSAYEYCNSDLAISIYLTIMQI